MAGDTRTAPEEPMVGEMATIGGGIGRRYLTWMFTATIVFGLGLLVFGALGGADFFDTAQPAEDRARQISMQRPFLMILSLAPLGLALFGRVAFKAAASSVHQATPKGAARMDPYAWMMFVTRLGAGGWIGPCEGRSFAIQRIWRRNGDSGLRLSLVVNARTRVAWMRRPAAGRAIDAAAGLESEDGGRYGFDGLDVAFSESVWAKRLFDAEGVQDAIRTLAADERVVLIILRPGRLLVQFPYGTRATLDEPQLRTWVATLCTLATAIEENGPPEKNLEPNQLERLADERDTPRQPQQSKKPRP